MEFAIISPTAGLERYSRLSKTHLVLLHQCMNDDDYLEFYTERSRQGDTIILDNGSYETGEPSHNWDVIRQLEPDIVVLPDFLLQPWKKTWHASIAFLDKESHDAQEFEWLYIPQALPGDLHGFIQSYLEAAEDSRITWLGIPRALATDISHNPLARVEFARMVRERHPHLKLHAFGMVNGDIHEIPYLAQVGVASIDSSAPVWRGWNEYDIRDKTWDGLPVDFSVPDRPLQEALIKSNLEACGVTTTNPGE